MLTDIKGEIDKNTIVLTDFNTSLTSMDRSYRKKEIKKARDPKWHNKTVELNWYLYGTTFQKRKKKNQEPIVHFVG